MDAGDTPDLLDTPLTDANHLTVYWSILAATRYTKWKTVLDYISLSPPSFEPPLITHPLVRRVTLRITRITPFLHHSRVISASSSHAVHPKLPDQLFPPLPLHRLKHLAGSQWIRADEGRGTCPAPFLHSCVTVPSTFNFSPRSGLGSSSRSRPSTSCIRCIEPLRGWWEDLQSMRRLNRGGSGSLEGCGGTFGLVDWERILMSTLFYQCRLRTGPIWMFDRRTSCARLLDRIRHRRPLPTFDTSPASSSSPDYPHCHRHHTRRLRPM